MQNKLSYSSFPRDHESLNSDWYRFYQVIKLLEKVAPGNVNEMTNWLDIGCHSGAFLRALGQIYRVRGYGCDVYPEIDKEERRYDCFQVTDNSAWEYKQNDVSLGLKYDRKFQVISALEVIEHVIDTDRFLEDIHAHLVEDGLFIVTTPNINSLRNRINVPLGAYPDGMEYRNVIHHVRLYNVPAIKSHFMTHGLDVLAIAGVQMLPRRWIYQSSHWRLVSEIASEWLPSLAPNIIVIARRRSAKQFQE